jgi:Holliday junction resolvase RusA-like endonuclease
LGRNGISDLAKPNLDSMKRIGLTEDDEYIYHLEVFKFPITSEEEMQIWIKKF